MRPERPRSPLAGPEDGPTTPFPIQLSGPVVQGFGRGSRELGIPTANIPLAGLSVGGHEDVDSGVYYGWAGIDIDEEGNRIKGSDGGAGQGAGDGEEGKQGQEGNDGDGEEDAERVKKGEDQEKVAEGKRGQVWAMVMSIGFNPYYNNTVRSVVARKLIEAKEVHILHSFPRDFYDARMNLLIMGFIRPEYDYVSKESLIEDIRVDIDVARSSLERHAYEAYKADPYLLRFEGEGHENTVAS